MSLTQVLNSTLETVVDAANENPYVAGTLAAAAVTALAITTAMCCFSKPTRTAKDKAREAAIGAKTSQLGNSNTATTLSDELSQALRKKKKP